MGRPPARMEKLSRPFKFSRRSRIHSCSLAALTTKYDDRSPEATRHCGCSKQFSGGIAIPDMESKGWSLSDQALKDYQLPHSSRPTLVLWGESSILGRDDRGTHNRLRFEASSRNVAWLFGTEEETKI